jgi:hypothetical protein
VSNDININSAARIPWLGLLLASALVTAALALGDTAIADLVAAAPVQASTPVTG